MPPAILSRQLNASDDLIRSHFAALKSREDVANLLEVPEHLLRTILYGSRERKRYRTFTIPKKSGGTRTVSAPPKNLGILQAKLAYVLQRVYRRKPAAQGFLLGRDTLTNAQKHIGRRFVLNVDLKDFFPSIHFGRVAGMFRGAPYLVDDIAALVLAQICCDDAGILPQGAPSSPMVSNMVCGPLDTTLQQLAKRFRCTYSRYADDITFSTTQRVFPLHLAIRNSDGSVTAGSVLLGAIQDHGFELNPKKTRLSRRNERQVVTGLTVNEFPNVPRKYVREIRAMLHDWDSRGYEAAANEYEDKYAPPGFIPNADGRSFERVVVGKLAYLRMVRGKDDPVYRKLRAKLHFIDPGVMGRPTPVAQVNPSKLRGTPSPTVDWSKIARRLASSICLLQVGVEDPDKGFVLHANGTTFAYRSGLFATAGHNLDGRAVRVFASPQKIIAPAGSVFANTTFGSDCGLIRLPGRYARDFRPIPTQYRIPEIGEEVAAIGFPSVPRRDTSLVTHVGRISALPTDYSRNDRFLQVNLSAGGGMSGSPLVDRRGLIVGIMVESVFNPGEETKDGFTVPGVEYAQAMPIGYVHYLPKTDL